MELLDTATKRSQLRWLYNQLQTSGQTFLEALEQRHATCAAAIADGQIVAGSSTNGQTVTLSTPGAGAPTPQQMASLWEEMLTRYDEAVVSLGGTPQDSAIYGEMLLNLQPIREVSSDFSAMRYCQ